MIGVRFAAKERDLSVPHSVQTGYGAQLVSDFMCTEGSSRGTKGPELEANHSLPSSAEINNSGNTQLHGVVLDYILIFLSSEVCLISNYSRRNKLYESVLWGSNKY
jgi:hypothetical protein